MTQIKDHWHVVYTRTKSEKKIYNHLCEREIDAFLPLRKVVKQWSDRKKKIEEPLFPNYVFVRMDERYYYEILNVPGITKFISFNGNAACVPNKEIESIKALIGACDDVANENYYEIGDHVRVCYGPLAGLEGMLIDKKGSKKFALRLDAIEQSLSVRVDTKYLERIA